MDGKLGRVMIAPNVLVTIAQRTATTVAGVDRLSDNAPGVKRFLGIRSVGQGIDVRVVDDRVSVDVYLIARRNVDLLRMARQIQREVTRSIQDIVGKAVHEVNVHIEDVTLEPQPQPGTKKEPAG